MPTAHPMQAGVATGTAITVARALAFLAITLGAGTLVYYLAVYIRDILVAPYEDRWWYLVVGVAAAVVYGVAGLAALATSFGGADAFRIGATLFFFLFSAVGIRALYATTKRDRGGPESASVPDWVLYVVIGAFIVMWWGTYLSGIDDAVALVEAVGLIGAVFYTLAFAILTVRDAEGTAVAAVIRQFVPGLVCFAGVVVAEQAGRYTPVDPGVVIGVELVGTALVGAFLFTTAVAIRQQGGEISRMYDRTTWRGQELE